MRLPRFADRWVLAAIEDERRAVRGGGAGENVADDDDVVAAAQLGIEAADQVRETAVADRHAVLHAVVHRRELLRLAPLARDDARDVLLVGAKHVDAEPLGLADGLERP